MNDLKAFAEEVRIVWEQGAFGFQGNQLIAALGILVVAMLLRGVFTTLVLKAVGRLTRRTDTEIDDQILTALRGPLKFVFLVIGLFFASRAAPLPPEVDIFLTRIIRSMIAFTIFWTLYSMATPFSFLLDKAAQAMGGRDLGDTLKNFAVRVLKVIIVVLGFAAVLQEWNFDIAAVLGGLGLIGMAVAFGAQNLISNLFGGLAIFLDKIFIEGHWIKTADVEGTVEKIGFRTTKIRCFDKSLVTLPNSKLSDQAVTNFSMMTNRRIYWKIGLEYRSTTQQLQQVVQGINDEIYGNDNFETDPARATTLIHVDSFNDSSIDIMLYCFTTTTKWAEWMRVKEELLFHIKGLVEDAGTSFAFPSSSIYVESLPFDGKPEPIPAREEAA